MPIHPSSSPKTAAGRLRKMPVTTRVGIIFAIIVGGIGALSGGFWKMLLLVAIFVLVTAAYGLIFRRTTWMRLPRKRAAAALGSAVALAVLIGSSAALGATHPASPTPPDRAVAVSASSNAATTHTAAPKKTHTPTPRPTPVVTTKLVAETAPIPFKATTVTTATKPKGVSAVTTAGVNGVETKTYTVTYTDGTETARVLKSDVVTTPPVNQVTTVGTYVAPPPPPPAPVAPAAPACTNGTYVNTAGNTVCSPEVSSSAPSGATAKCGDGSYSFSQSRRGTCSSHGGVAVWL